MTFVQLTYFKAVCDCGNISRAAQQLHVSSPAISVSIKNLEQEFGIQLFLRSGARLILTEEGRLFLNEVSAFLQEFDRISAIAGNIAKAPHTIRYGTVPLAGSYLTPLILHNFYTRYPNESIVSQENTPENLVDMVRTGELDAIVIPRGTHNAYDLSNEKLEHMVVKPQQFYFATYPKHPLAERRSVSVRDIGNTPLVLLHGSYSQNRLIGDMYHTAGMKPNVIYRTVQLKTIDRFITQGIASSFMYQGLAAETEGIVGIPVDELPEAIQLILIWRKSEYMFSSVRKFIRSVKELIPYL